ncbi:hypothetical protein V8D89_002616 [Ganoderma adspersum]
MVNMLAYPCTVCGDYGCLQEHGWCHMDDGVLFQTLLKGLEEMVRRSSNARAPYPGGAGMMDSPAQYIYSSAYPPMIYTPTFDARGPFGAKDMDMLTARMGNTFITPPAHSADIWAAHGSASVSGQQGGGSYEYDVFPPWQEGYVSVPQDADHDDEGIRYDEQHVNFPVELSFVPTAPDPVPSISVVEHLEQGTYQYKQVVEGTAAGPIHFNAGLGVCYGALDALADGAEPAFSSAASIGVKASLRFELPQQSMPQVRVRRGGGKGREGRPITLREMGERVFDELKKLMDRAEDGGKPLQHQGSVVDIERVVLLRVDHISRGSIQPILGIRKNG